MLSSTNADRQTLGPGSLTSFPLFSSFIKLLQSRSCFKRVGADSEDESGESKGPRKFRFWVVQLWCSSSSRHRVAAQAHWPSGSLKPGTWNFQLKAGGVWVCLYLCLRIKAVSIFSSLSWALTQIDMKSYKSFTVSLEKSQQEFDSNGEKKEDTRNFVFISNQGERP